jgi:endoglucanase
MTLELLFLSGVIVSMDAKKTWRGSRRERVAALTMVVGMVLAQPWGLAQGAGFWHTSGNRILDSNNEPVRVTGINWSGFETSAEVVHGLYAQDYRYILDAIKSNGFNSLRLPFSNQMVEYPIVPSAAYVAYSNASGPINTDLEGLNSLEILDRIVAYAGQIGVRIILDNHRSENGLTAEENGLWYTAQYPESDWIADWEMLAARYKSSSAVIGMDLRNEPHSVGNGGACWACGTVGNDWRLAAERAGNAILKVNPKLLIFVEGTDTKTNQAYWWGGNLQGVKSYPVVLNVKNQLVYSPHDYGPDLYPQSWFNAKTTPASLEALWDATWGYVSQQKIAPILLGEFGTPNSAASLESSDAGSQGQWFETMAHYLAVNPNIGWTYWDLGEDADALLDGNWDSTPVSAEKEQILAALEFKLGTTSQCAELPVAPAGLTAVSASSSSIQIDWTPVAAPVSCSVTYSVFRGATSGFVPSSANEVSSGLTAPAFEDRRLAASTSYYYRVTAADALGTSAASAQASATTRASDQGAACHVSYSIGNSWDLGFQASLVLENTGSTNLTSWTLAWTFPNNQEITNFWVGGRVAERPKRDGIEREL